MYHNLIQYRDTPKRTHYLHKISHLTNRVENSLHYQPNTRFPLKSVGGIQPKNCNQLIDDRRIPVFLENSQLIWSAAHLSYLLTRSATFSAVYAQFMHGVSLPGHLLTLLCPLAAVGDCSFRLLLRNSYSNFCAMYPLSR